MDTEGRSKARWGAVLEGGYSKPSCVECFMYVDIEIITPWGRENAQGMS
jgi:hypothetical protein